MKTSDVLRKAGDMLRDTGWCQHWIGRSGGPHCAVGAVIEASGGEFNAANIQPLRDVTTGGERLIDVWNDEPRRTIDEVLVAMDAAYVLALQEEGVEPEDVL